MRVYDAKNIKFKDGLTEKRRKVYIFKTLFFFGLIIAIAGFILYLIFFSGLLEINQVNVSGLNKISGDEFNKGLNDRLDSKWLGFLKRERNLVFFRSDSFRAEMLDAFPEIKEISIKKEPLHTLNIDVTERMTVGIWCFASDSTGLTTNCKYFDEEGKMWGEAAKSSGFLVLVVEDMRQDMKEIVQQGLSRVDSGILADIILISAQLKEMNIFINKFTIPDKFTGDFNASTSGGYELIFSTNSDIKEQLEVLEIFLTDKKSLSAQAGDPDFKPQYIDLRINGRIYYK